MELELTSIDVASAGVCGTLEEDTANEASAEVLSRGVPAGIVDDGAAFADNVTDELGDETDTTEDESTDESEVCEL